MINVLVNGATGKMGRLAVKHIAADPQLKLVATPTRHDDLADAIKKSHAQVALDLTSAEVVYQNTKTIIKAGCAPVIVTSGLTAAQIAELQKLAEQHKVGGMIVPNFSISAVLMMQFSEIACRYFDKIKIIETHHPEKKDKPSGTARRTAELMAAAKKIKYEDIEIESRRLEGAVAEQEVLFASEHETLTIKQNSFDRECFMPGIILSCHKAPHLTSLVVGLDKILI